MSTTTYTCGVHEYPPHIPRGCAGGFLCSTHHHYVVFAIMVMSVKTPKNHDFRVFQNMRFLAFLENFQNAPRWTFLEFPILTTSEHVLNTQSLSPCILCSLARLAILGVTTMVPEGPKRGPKMVQKGPFSLRMPLRARATVYILVPISDPGATQILYVLRYSKGRWDPQIPFVLGK